MEKQKAVGVYRKSWCRENLFGTSRFDFTPAIRGVWNDLLDMAKISRIPGGTIAPGVNQKYTHEYLANLLNTPLETFNEAMEIFIKTDRVIENGSGITIVNWHKYQTEYDRQKPYRDKKKIEEQDPDKFVKGKYGHMVRR